jgi:hypothetical protein
MKRPSPLDNLSGERQSLQEVWAWYEFQRTLINEEKGRVLDPPAGSVSLATSRYAGKTREELKADFAYQIAELDQVTMLGMLASTEAAFRVDFIERVWNKKSDKASHRFLLITGGRWWDPFSGRGIHGIRLDEDILDPWREHSAHPDIRHIVSEFKGALKLRHWLAHGRYWEPGLGRSEYDPKDLFGICSELLNATVLAP